MFVTNSDEYAATSEKVRIFGESLRPGVARPYMAGGMGWNYKSNEITAAFGRVQLSRLDETNKARIEMSEFLTTRLKKLAGSHTTLHPRLRKERLPLLQDQG